MKHSIRTTTVLMVTEHPGIAIDTGPQSRGGWPDRTATWP